LKYLDPFSIEISWNKDMTFFDAMQKVYSKERKPEASFTVQYYGPDAHNANGFWIVKIGELEATDQNGYTWVAYQNDKTLDFLVDLTNVTAGDKLVLAYAKLKDFTKNNWNTPKVEIQQKIEELPKVEGEVPPSNKKTSMDEGIHNAEPISQQRCNIS